MTSVNLFFSGSKIWETFEDGSCGPLIRFHEEKESRIAEELASTDKIKHRFFEILGSTTLIEQVFRTIVGALEKRECPALKKRYRQLKVHFAFSLPQNLWYKNKPDKCESKALVVLNSLKDEGFSAEVDDLSLACSNKWHQASLFIVNQGIDLSKLNDGKAFLCGKYFLDEKTDSTILQQLDRQGFNFFVLNSSGQTFMHVAAENENLAHVQFLLSLGLSLNTKDGDGMTPLFGVKSLSFFRKLIEMGADHRVQGPADLPPYIQLEIGSYIQYVKEEKLDPITSGRYLVMTERCLENVAVFFNSFEVVESEKVKIVKLAARYYKADQFGAALGTFSFVLREGKTEIALQWLANKPNYDAIAMHLFPFLGDNRADLDQCVDLLLETGQYETVIKLLQEGLLLAPSLKRKMGIANQVGRGNCEYLRDIFKVMNFTEDEKLKTLRPLVEGKGISNKLIHSLICSLHCFTVVDQIIEDYGIDIEHDLKYKRYSEGGRVTSKCMRALQLFHFVTNFFTKTPLSADEMKKLIDSFKQNFYPFSLKPFYPLFKAIFNEKEKLRENKLRWLLQLICDSKLRQIKEDESEKNLPFYTALYNLRDHRLRHTLTKRFMTAYYGPTKRENLEIWQWIRPQIAKRTNALLIVAILVPYLDESFYEMLIKKVESKSETDGIHIRRLAQGFSALTSLFELSDEKKRALLRDAYDNKTKVERAAYAELLHTVIGFGLGAQLETVTTLQECKELVNQPFRAICNSVEIPDFYERYAATIAQYRSPESIIVYASGLKKLSKEDQDLLLPLVGHFVKGVLHGTFLVDRMETDLNPHLAQIKAIDPEFYEQWRKSTGLITSSACVTSLEDQTEEDVFDFRQFFKEQLFIHKHLTLHPEKDLPNLAQALSDQSFTMIEGPYLKMEKAIIKFLNHQCQKPDALFRKISGLIPPTSEFARTVKEKSETFTKKGGQNQMQDWQVGIAIHPWDYLRLGSDVQESCQRLDSHPEDNKCLLSFLLDGKNLPIVVKEGDKVIGRCILRALISQNQIVLFRERFYTDRKNNQINNLLTAFSHRIAKELKKPLSTTRLEGNEEGEVYPHPLHSLDGRVKYEYVDALGNRVDQNVSKFTIPEVIQIIFSD